MKCMVWLLPALLLLGGCSVHPDMVGEWGWSASGGCGPGAPRFVVGENEVRWIGTDGQTSTGVGLDRDYHVDGCNKVTGISLTYLLGEQHLRDRIEVKWHFGSASFELISRHADGRKVKVMPKFHQGERLVACD